MILPHAITYTLYARDYGTCTLSVEGGEGESWVRETLSGLVENIYVKISFDRVAIKVGPLGRLEPVCRGFLA